MLGKFAGIGVALLMFIAAMIIAGIIMAFGELGTRSALEIASRIFAPGRGGEVTTLCTATIRAVAKGVVGIASSRCSWSVSASRSWVFPAPACSA